ncbi:Sorting and assembly machinery component 50-like protein B [Sciurus carolinensis]|uniref:Sorting and assembly machinery component 50-like protein B n=1 Tax=Sciurus carolinensis TaxID=30640 RepID=A0AA41MPL3_SCICA|nr:Sorting and assembly machinery component 50-like protein B [Sciurus carolinensis]
MGTVHAQSLEHLPSNGPDFGALGEEAEFVEVEPEVKQEILENKDMIVQHVHFNDLGRTRDDVIMYEIGDVFKARNLIEVMRKSHKAGEKLLRLGIFRQVDVLKDTCQGDDVLPNGLDITFEVTELRKLMGSYNTMVRNNEGSMVLSLKLPNLLERAEKVIFQFSYGTKETSYGLKESGHSLKLSLSHTMVINSGNFSILPTRGTLLKVNQERAGYTAGDVSFLKEEFELQLNKQLVLDSVFSASLWGGMLVPFGEKPSSIANRFYLGGPTSIHRLSMHRIGPQSKGDYLGGEGYWAGGLHLYTLLPFQPGQEALESSSEPTFS